MVDARRGRLMPHWPREGVDVTAKLPNELGVDRASAGRLNVLGKRDDHASEMIKILDT
jgi:hypothetical protein